MRFVLKWLLLCLFILPGLTIAAQETTPEATAETDENQVAWVRFTHVSADTAELDVYIDDELAFENIEFLEVTPYLSVEAGTHEVALVPAGADIEVALQTRAGALAAGHTYILGASGLSEAFNMFVLDETGMIDSSYEPVAEQMGERDALGWFIILHAIEDGPALSVVFQTGENVAENLTFGGYYASPVIPGNYPILIMTADGQDIIFNQLNPLDIHAGLLYFVIMTGTADDPQLQLSVSGTKTIEEILLSSDALSTFTDALDGAGLSEMLATEGQFTVFAPPNGAFDGLDEETLDSTVEYHIVPGSYQLNDIRELETLTTLSGEEITVGNAASDNSQLSILLNDVPLEFSGVLGINGIVYLVNSLLMPTE